MLDRGQFTGLCALCGAHTGSGVYCHTHKWAAGQVEPPRLEQQTVALLRMAELAEKGQAA